MLTEQIPFNQTDKYLSNTLLRAGYTNIPSNVILNKTLTGIGATYMEIIAKRNSIIIEPNVPVITGKVEQHPECLAVYKGCKTAKIKRYLLNPDYPYKKLITTPESFKKILEVAQELQIDLFNTYFCLFDECEKISQDFEYRKSISYPMKNFYDFSDKAFVSATPVGLANRLLEKLGFSELKVIPENFDHRIDLELITTNVILRTIVNKLQALLLAPNPSIFVFYNSIRGIKQLIDQFNISPENYAIFCSDTRSNDLETEGYNVQKNVDKSTIKKFNFLTSRYFSAVDFKLDICPDIVLITNQSLATHSKIDPLSEAIQIQGRFRTEQPNGKRFNSICHITDLVIYVDAKTPAEIDEELKEWYKSAKLLKERYKVASTPIKKKAILKEYKHNPIYQYFDTPDFDTPFRINIFSLLNRHYKERMKKSYTSKANLINTYNEADYFNITHTNAYANSLSFYDLDLPLKRINKNIPQKDQIKAVISQLEKGVKPGEILILHKDNPDQYINIKITIEAYELLGIKEVQKQNTFAAIEKKLISARKFRESEELRFSVEIINRIKTEFENDLNIPLLKTDIQNRLQQIYDTFGLIKKNEKAYKVTQETIKDYFNSNRDNATGKRNYTLISLLPHIESKISV